MCSPMLQADLKPRYARRHLDEVKSISTDLLDLFYLNESNNALIDETEYEPSAVLKYEIDSMKRQWCQKFILFEQHHDGPMQYVLGGAVQLNTTYYIPLLGLGTYKITGNQVKPSVNAALKCGFRLFDTAKYYQNEAELGAALEELLPVYKLTREDVYLLTKFHMNPDDPAGYARKAVDESLRLLRTTYLDMVMIHYPKAPNFDDEDERNKEHRKLTYLELEKIKDEGKIRSVGVSNYEIIHLEEIKTYSEMVPAANQVEIHPHLTRSVLRRYCDKEGIFSMAFASLARLEPALINEPLIKELAKKYNTTAPLILLAFGLCQGIGVIPRSTDEKELRQDAEAVNIKLSKEEIDSLEKLDQGKNYIRNTGWTVV